MSWSFDNRQQFQDRREAGTALAALLSAYKDRDDVVVLALPRGGVPVAYEGAGALGAPLDVFFVEGTMLHQATHEAVRVDVGVVAAASTSRSSR